MTTKRKQSRSAVQLMSLTLAMLAVLAGCRTVNSDSAIREAAAGESTLRCSFASPFNPGEGLEVAAIMGARNNLLDAKVVYTPGKDLQSSADNIDRPRQLDKAAATQNGSRGFRSCFKDLIDVDFKAFDCFDVAATAGSRKASILCLARAGDKVGAREAYWATNVSSQHFAKELTVYQSTCSVR